MSAAASAQTAKTYELPWIAVKELTVSPNRLEQPRWFARLGAFQTVKFLALLAATAMGTTVEPVLRVLLERVRGPYVYARAGDRSSDRRR